MEHPLFRVEHPPQLQTVAVGWKFKLTVLLFEFKFFHPHNSSIELGVDVPNFSSSCTLFGPQNQKVQSEIRYQGITNYRVGGKTLTKRLSNSVETGTKPWKPRQLLGWKISTLMFQCKRPFFNLGWNILFK